MSEKNYRAELVGVFGDPVDGNPTGVVEEAAFAAAGLNWRYLTCRVRTEDLAAAMGALRALSMKGINLTMPLKTAVLPYLDELSTAASIIGAVNTVAVRGDRLFGENTDGKGFVTSLREANIPVAGRTVTMLGAGGAARAISVECALAGAARIHVVNRNAERGEALVRVLGEHTGTKADYRPWRGTADIPEDTDILINGTNVGLAPDSESCPDVALDRIHPGMTVCDVVFNPAMPPFLREASRRGALVVPGLGMLVNQAALNFELWTGVSAPKAVMEEALRREFGAY